MKHLVVGTITVLMVISLLVGCNHDEKTEAVVLNVVGKWKLAAGSQSSDCFSGMRFLEDPTSKRSPISVHETTGDFTQIWFGEYEKEKNDIRVILHEPKADPFMMVADRNGNELKLQYEWKSAHLVCSYQPDS